jgi:hypothetical protein
LYKSLKTKNIYNLKKNIDLKGVVYIVRLMRHKKSMSKHFKYTLGMSKPCKRCECFLYRHNIKKIKYTDVINGINVLCEMKINK